MSIRNPVLFGLKVAFNFTDALSKFECLSNLGLDIRDLDVIRGINEEVVKLDLQNVSGLDVNLTRYLDRLKSDTGLYSGIVNELGGYQYTLQGNLEAFGPLSGGAVRYQYIPSDKGSGLTKSDLKYGDISTSRVSSWSGSSPDETDTDQAISYGASVQVKGAVKVGQRPGWAGPGSTEAVINVLDTPEPIRFPTEIATDVLEIELNGATKYLYAMRGIPVIFTTAFKNLSMNFEFLPIAAGNPVFTIQATDLSESEITSTPPSSGNISRLRYNSPSYKERFVKLYYPPNNIRGITASSLNIRHLPRVKFFNLDNITVSNNLLGEMPDWREINYVYDRDVPENAPTSSLRYINIGNNPVNQTDDENLQQFGTDVVERLPKQLRDYYGDGTYNAHTTFKLIHESCVIVCTSTEYNAIIVDPSTKVDNSFTQQLVSGGPNETTIVNGYYWDKQVHPVTGEYYVYVKEPKITKDSSWTTVNISDEIGWQSIVITTFNRYKSYFKPLNLATRCPNLQTYRQRNSSGRRIYKNTNTKGPDPAGQQANVKYQTDYEYTPSVDLSAIKTYDVYDNSYNKLAREFTSPSEFLGAGASSALTSFTVSENESLSEIADLLDFNLMNNISSIDIYDTGLPIPSNLTSKTSLTSLNCNYTRFPSRTDPSPLPSAYPVPHPSGGFVDAQGNGNPSAMTNNLFRAKYPLTETEYELNGCTSLSSLSFYGSRLSGMIPKFLGNDNLSSIDFRYTSIEGGRPKEFGAVLSGRRYVMWDDTFEDAQNIKSIRIRSDVLGRNIGIYNPVTKEYTEASFQGSTFSLPLLETIDITSTNQYLKGAFFNTNNTPNLKYLYSISSGWGQDIPGGATLPSFAANTNIIEINLSGNNFSGNIVLTNANKLRKYYVQNNIINGVDLNNFSGLSSLQYFIISNNKMRGQIPNFSVACPNIQYISLANNEHGIPSVGGNSVFVPGSLANCPKLKSFDISNNKLNENTVDDILKDAVDNYNNAPRRNVVINVGGDNQGPSTNPVPIQSTVTTTTNEIFTVSQNPLSPQTTFFKPQDFSIDLKDGVSTLDPNFQFSTEVKQNGVDITNTLNIQYGSDVIQWVSGAFPPDGATIEIIVTTVQTVTTIVETGGLNTLKQLRQLGWIITVNNDNNNIT